MWHGILSSNKCSAFAAAGDAETHSAVGQSMRCMHLEQLLALEAESWLAIGAKGKESVMDLTRHTKAHTRRAKG